MAEGAGPDLPSLEQLRGQHHSWLVSHWREDTARHPWGPGLLVTRGRRLQPSSRPPLRHLDVPTVVSRGSRGSQVLPPSPTPGLSQHQLRQSLGLQLRGGPGLGPCVQAMTTPHPRALSPLREWRLGSGDRTKLGSPEPQALCQPAVLGHLMAHADAAQRWGKIPWCIWLLENIRS